MQRSGSMRKISSSLVFFVIVSELRKRHNGVLSRNIAIVKWNRMPSHSPKSLQVCELLQSFHLGEPLLVLESGVHPALILLQSMLFEGLALRNHFWPLLSICFVIWIERIQFKFVHDSWIVGRFIYKRFL